MKPPGFPLRAAFDLSAELLKTIAHTTRGLRENCNITSCRQSYRKGGGALIWWRVGSRSVHRSDVPASYLFDIWLRFVIGEFINDIYNKNKHAMLQTGGWFFFRADRDKKPPKKEKDAKAWTIHPQGLLVSAPGPEWLQKRRMGEWLGHSYRPGPVTFLARHSARSAPVCYFY